MIEHLITLDPKVMSLKSCRADQYCVMGFLQAMFGFSLEAAGGAVAASTLPAPEVGFIKLRLICLSSIVCL